MQIKQAPEHDPDAFPLASAYDIDVDGRQFLLRKEYYAGGPAMFSWVLYRVTDPVAGFTTHVDAFTSKKRAIAYLNAKYPTP